MFAADGNGNGVGRVGADAAANYASEERDRQRHEAFARYILPEMPLLTRVAKSRTARSSDAEDLVQDTLLSAYQAIERFDGAYPRAWLLTIMRNHQINRARRRRPEVLDDIDGSFARLGALDRGPEAALVETTFDAAVADAFAAIPQRFRDVVELVDIDGLSYAGAAAALGIPVGTVMSRLHRGRNGMKNRLETAGYRPNLRGLSEP
jgi:RNA polymerase sigma-70 factor (ECF subfamily)